MPIRSLHVAGYRSIRDIRLELGQLNVLTGPNGCGKSNLYQSMYLLHAAARGELARTLAEEGGMPSVLWAGRRQKLSKKAPIRMCLAIELDDLAYEIRCGLAGSGGFDTDPEVREEYLHPVGQPRLLLLERANATCWVRDSDGFRVTFPFEMSIVESVLPQVIEPHLYPQLTLMSNRLSRWRFYHHFRTDLRAPTRQPQFPYTSDILDADGKNLAAVLATILYSDEDGVLARAIDDAFPGVELLIAGSRRQSVALRMPGIQRPLEARELSDGTIRYLCLLAALLSPTPPALMALNEPETSLHPDLIRPLARLITAASARSQMWITTHSLPLAEAIEAASGRPRIQLHKVEGETKIIGQKLGQ